MAACLSSFQSSRHTELRRSLLNAGSCSRLRWQAGSSKTCRRWLVWRWVSSSCPSAPSQSGCFPSNANATVKTTSSHRFQSLRANRHQPLLLPHLAPSGPPSCTCQDPCMLHDLIRLLESLWRVFEPSSSTSQTVDLLPLFFSPHACVTKLRALQVPITGPVETRIKNGTNDISGFDTTEEVDLTTTASAPAQNGSLTGTAPGVAVSPMDRSFGNLGALGLQWHWQNSASAW